MLTLLTLAITCGSETDTIASISGQIAGTVVGAIGIDSQHIEQLEDSKEIVGIATQFADFVCQTNS